MIEIGLDVTGQFTVEKRRGGLITETRTWRNTVLDSAFNRLIQYLHGSDGYTVARFLFLGTGTSEPTRLDAGLEQRSTLAGMAVAGVSTSGYLDSLKGDRFADVVLRYDYGVGQATGVWTELGTATDAEYTLPFNRALIRDENDFPTPLDVQADESVSIYLRLRLREAMGYPTRISFTLPDETQTMATVEPLEPVSFTDSGSRNIWRAGYANRSGKLLNAGRGNLTYSTLPWPYSPPDSTVSPSVTYEHNYDTRTTRMKFTLGASKEETVFIHGVGLGPGNDFIYRVMFDEPITKPSLKSLTFDVTIGLHRTTTD